MAPPNPSSDERNELLRTIVKCPDCGKDVPEANMTIHSLRACKGRARAPQGGGEEEKSEEAENEVIPMEVDNEQDVSMSESPFASTEQNLQTPTTGLRRRRSKRRSRQEDEGNDGGSSDDILQVADVVDLVSPERDDNAGNTPSNSDNHNDTQNEEWACSRCTLLNPIAQGHCEACNARNPNRPPDPTRSERLINDDFGIGGGNGNTMPMSYVGHGALLGGMLGAAGSFMRGRSLFSGAAEGAMTGVVGGALLNEVLNVSSTASENHNPNIAEARSSAAMGTPAYPSFSNNEPDAGNRRARPRSSYRVIQRRGEDGRTTTIIQGGTGGSTRITRRSTGGLGGAAINDPLLSLMLHSLMQQGTGQAGVEGMDYEQLLRAFGDGTENMGADESQISRLPTRELTNPEAELPEDARQCLICLEDFTARETRTTMPCLHGFHKECAEKWLRTNGSCPICKHRLE